ncbi:MAG: DUF4347 domain-containing protein, partial [Pseudomonadales bacterium]
MKSFSPLLSGHGLLRKMVACCSAATPTAGNNPNSNVQSVFERLEPRVLLSADALGGIAANDLLHDDDSPDSGSLIDSRDLNQLVAPFLNPADRHANGGEPAFDALDLAELNSLQEDYLSVAEAFGESGSMSVDLQAWLPVFQGGDEGRQEIIFVDGATPDYESMVADIAQHAADTEYLVFILDTGADGIGQISDVLSSYSGVDAVHVVSHGTAGALQLGNATLSEENFHDAAVEIAGWRTALDPGADLLIYGCDLAANDAGLQLIAQLAGATGADVAASDDLTGAAALGGDWELEFSAGSIETQIAFSASFQQQWQHTLDIFTVNTYADTVDINPGDGVALDAGGNTSLRAAIMEANALGGADVIELSAGTYDLTRGVTGEDEAAQGDLDITSNITIVGAGATDTTIDANGIESVFHLKDNNADLTLRNLTVTGGNQASGKGGGIWLDDG